MLWIWQASESDTTENGRPGKTQLMKRSKRSVRLVFLLLWYLQFVYSQTTGLTVVKNGNLRENPSTAARIIAHLKPSQRLVILEQNADWYRVQTDHNQTGWVNAIVVEPLSPLESAGFGSDQLKLAQQQWSQAVSQSDSSQLSWEKMTTRQPGKIYALPEEQAETVADVPAGTTVHRLDSSGDWFYIQTADNIFGWVHQALFKPAGKVKTVPPKNPIRLAKNGNLRQHPSTTAAIIQIIPAGAIVDLLDSTADWRQVRTADQKIGWLNNIVFQKIQPAEKAVAIREATLARSGNLRRSPNLNAPIVTKLPAGQKVTILTETGDWHKIKLNNGSVGWIHKILFEKPVDLPPVSAQPEQAATAIAPLTTAPDTTSKTNVFTDELASAEEYHANRNIVKAVDNYFYAEKKLAKSAAAAPRDICLKYRLAKSHYALANSLYTKENPTLSETMASVRNAAFSNVPCSDDARKTLDLWEEAVSLRTQILSIFSLDSVNLRKITKSVTETPGKLPILYEAEAKYMIGRYYLSRRNDPREAITWLDESVSLFQAYDRNRPVASESNLENYFKACLDLGTAYSQVAQYSQSSAAFNLAYHVASRAQKPDWLQYYQKVIRAITDRMD